ncbi:hypothetical protein AT864_01483 [Anoxybacillus sp. P3H1B]|jgi:hypothetical protein|uniref:hypothetical protein n=1 Tax=Anoxybacillus sp. P3H1B TaxID=1769293 RepID=UPI00079698D3|nr:hypothetical protein [Anoxybacillus sp. P3H1B]KXG09923.1 hypothetical protein AT864_01483 [Anoxybacillus sp. P3H1B]
MQENDLLQEVILLEKTLQCIEYIQDAVQNRDYESMKIEISELQFLAKRLQEIEEKRVRRAKLMEVVKDLRRRGIRIDFVSSERMMIHE